MGCVSRVPYMPPTDIRSAYNNNMFTNSISLYNNIIVSLLSGNQSECKNFMLHYSGLYYYYYTFAAAGGAGATCCVTGAAFKEVNVVGFSIGLHSRSAPIVKL